MKKILFLTTLAIALTFASCSNDDDGGSKCESCTSNAGNKFEICDNGDGTYTASENGVSETLPEEELGGLSIKLAVELACELDLEV
nr:hypothetical protein [uncultured Allomuricauda sp.]